MTAQNQQRDYMTVLFDSFIPQKCLFRLTPLHRGPFGIFTEKGWSSDFPPLPSAFSPKRVMAFMLRSHNGVHCCGTVGDSHPSSQLIAAKRTFTGEGRGYASTFTLTLFRITLQGRCKPRAIELARIAEVQPRSRNFVAKVQLFGESQCVFPVFC